MGARAVYLAAEGRASAESSFKASFSLRALSLSTVPRRAHTEPHFKGILKTRFKSASRDPRDLFRAPLGL